MSSILISSFYKWRIKANQRVFLRMVKDIAEGRSVAERCVRAQEAATYAVTHVTDVFSSAEVEKPFIELAQSIHVPLEESFQRGSVLHVLTEAYTSGGHTRCVERWIVHMAEHHHSCAVLNQRAPFPQQLREIVERSGGRMFMENPSLKTVQKAVNLRKLAALFEYVVLHIHMDDSTALIAFGTEEFHRPVVFFNHADHIFWLGVSIADSVADFRSVGHDITKKRRGVSHSVVLGIPLEDSNTLSVSQEEAREKLGINREYKVIYSGGQSAKYLPIGYPSFYDIISDLIHHEPNLQFYIAGINPEQSFWLKLMKKFPCNLHLFHVLNYDTEYPFYLAAADLVIDSWPAGGGTAAIDAVKAGKPILTLDREQQLDYLTQSEGVCNSYSELLHKAHQVLHDAKYARELHSDIQKRLVAEMSPEHWRQRCLTLFSELPPKHSLHSLSSPCCKVPISSVSLRTYRWVTVPYKVKLKEVKMKDIRRWLIQIHLKKDHKIIRLLGLYFVKINKKYDERTENYTLRGGEM